MATQNDAGKNDPKQPDEAPHKDATQRNEARRTPDSRNDRESHLGSGNQTQSREGGGNRRP